MMTENLKDTTLRLYTHVTWQMCVYSLVLHGDVRPRTTIVGKVFVVKALLIIGRVLSLKLRSNRLLDVGG